MLPIWRRHRSIPSTILSEYADTAVTSSSPRRTVLKPRSTVVLLARQEDNWFSLTIAPTLFAALSMPHSQ
jgi:hypothetical protein